MEIYNCIFEILIYEDEIYAMNSEVSSNSDKFISWRGNQSGCQVLQYTFLWAERVKSISPRMWKASLQLEKQSTIVKHYVKL